jgi:Zn-dependent protease
MHHHYKPKKVLGISSSENEIRDLLKAWLVISLAFGIVLSRRGTMDFTYSFVLAALTVGVGFIFHELAHKLVAQKFGCFAEFRANNKMLILALVMSFIGMIFAAPGAVMISGPVGRRRNGMISAAGIVANLILALLFLGVVFYAPFELLRNIGLYGIFINTLLAMFNLIPILNFDGVKVLNWSKTAYIVMVSMVLILMLLQGMFGGI